MGIWVLQWVPGQGLLVGGRSGLWLWDLQGEWQQLIALDASSKKQRIVSVLVLPSKTFTVLAGGDDGVYFWKEGDPTQSAPQNEAVKKAWSMVVVTQPEPYVLALTFDECQVWRMTMEGKDPVKWGDMPENGMALSVQHEDPLRVWVGAPDGFYQGEMRRRGSELIDTQK
jgi:hypothetical protein